VPETRWAREVTQDHLDCSAAEPVRASARSLPGNVEALMERDGEEQEERPSLQQIYSGWLDGKHLYVVHQGEAAAEREGGVPGGGGRPLHGRSLASISRLVFICRSYLILCILYDIHCIHL
jgi:hypothetical protein